MDLAGARANATLIAGLPGIADETQRPDNFRVRLRGDQAAEKLAEALESVEWSEVLPAVSPGAVAGLKFSEVLPRDLAIATIAERLADPDGARLVAAEKWRGPQLLDAVGPSSQVRGCAIGRLRTALRQLRETL